MTDLALNIVTSNDDGYCVKTTGSFFTRTSTNSLIGADSSLAYHAYFRFVNVTIPAGAEIESAVIRAIASNTRSGGTINVKLHCEAADSPSAPSSGADLVGRSLTTGTNWDGVPNMTAGNSYDSEDFAAELQAVVDRGGWNSGQSIIVHIIDNASTGLPSLPRTLASYDHATYTEPQLIVTYSTPIVGETSESFAIDDAIDADVPGLGETSNSFAVQDIINALNTSAPLSEAFYIGDIVDAESELLSALPESFSFGDAIEGYKEAESEQSDSFAADDEIDAFHYSAWLRSNLWKAKQRFFFTLTGAADLTTDIAIPIASFYARKRTGESTFLQVVVPGALYADEIATRPNGDMIIEMGYEVDGVITLREQILIADLEEIRPDEGAQNRSITLTGHRTITYRKNLVTFAKNQSSYRSIQGNNISHRFSIIDPYLNPGDTVIVGEDEFTAATIIYIVDPLRAVMEVQEGAVG